jgi:uncharacterized membrane protein
LWIPIYCWIRIEHMQIITHSKHATNLTRAERIISAAGGGLLAAVGIQKRSVGGAVLALLGGELLRRGVTGHCYAYEAAGIRTAPKGQGAETTSVPYELGIRVDEAVTIDRPREELYNFWQNFENLPRFMKHLDSVQQLGNGRSRWVACGPAGKRVAWEAVIHNQIPNEMIAWRSLPGSTVDNAGSVWFQDAPGGRGTVVKVELQYNPPAGAIGAIVAMLWGEEPGQQVAEDMRRFKQLMEAGEIIETTGQPSGRPQSRTDDQRVHEASQESFPASDAPSYTVG